MNSSTPSYTLQRWEDLINQAITTPNSRLANLRITLAHYRLSQALAEVIGPESGANFHTWAVWGSKKAGTTIRQEDVPGLTLVTGTIGGIAGMLGAISIGGKHSLLAPPVALAGAFGAYRYTQSQLYRATQAVLAGNITVLDDIGRATARFVCAMYDCTQPAAERLASFLATLRPGPTASGGQNLLHDAYTHYYLARYETDLGSKHEQMLLGNLKAILHEHLRLEPYISAAIPRHLRYIVTHRLLHYRLGNEDLSVGQDVPPWKMPRSAVALARVKNSDLLSFLSGTEGWDRSPDSLLASRASDWTNLHDRMNYICDLFRTRHLDPELFTSPYTSIQCSDIEAGRIPRGRL